MTEENIIGTYECDECNSMWFIRSTSVAGVYDGWLPVCPVCGLEDTVKQINTLRNKLKQDGKTLSDFEKLDDEMKDMLKNIDN